MDVSLFSKERSDMTRGMNLKLQQGMFTLDIREKDLHWKVYQALEQAAQGSDWVTVPGGI